MLISSMMRVSFTGGRGHRKSPPRIMRQIDTTCPPTRIPSHHQRPPVQGGGILQNPLEVVDLVGDPASSKGVKCGAADVGGRDAGRCCHRDLRVKTLAVFGSQALDDASQQKRLACSRGAETVGQQSRSPRSEEAQGLRNCAFCSFGHMLFRRSCVLPQILVCLPRPGGPALLTLHPAARPSPRSKSTANAQVRYSRCPISWRKTRRWESQPRLAPVPAFPVKKMLFPFSTIRSTAACRATIEEQQRGRGGRTQSRCSAWITAARQAGLVHSRG